MPIYEYRCTACGHEWSLALSIAEHEQAEPACPACGAGSAERRFSPFFAKTVRKS